MVNKVKTHPAETTAALGLAPAWYAFFVNAGTPSVAAAVIAAVAALAPGLVTWGVNRFRK